MFEYKDIVIFLVGFVSSIINVLAGGGSLLTLPLLIFYGLDANVANATNRVCIVVQSLVSSASFHKKKILDLKSGLIYAIPAMFGAVIGSIVAVDIDSDLMEKIIGIIMTAILVVVLFKPNNFLKEKIKKKTSKLNFLETIFSIIIGFYAGFIQAGVGYLMTFVFVIVGSYNLLYANALKMFLTLVLNALALAIFIYYDLVLWKIGTILALGSIFGGLLGTKLAIWGGVKFIRYVFIVLISIFIVILLRPNV